jgi:hypothetical protein
MTSQEFAQTAEYRSLSGVGLLFIDGHHTYEQARFDYELFESKLAPDGIVLLHDSMMLSAETYGGIQDLHMTGVTFFVDELQQRPDLEVFDFPRLRTPSIFCTGLTIVRRKTFEAGNVYRNPAVPEYQSLQTGINHFNRRDLPGAIECFSTVIDLQPKFSAAWLLKGTALVCAGAVDDGLYCLGRAEELGHGRAPALIAAIKRELSRC